MSPEIINNMPDGLKFLNITGGEPFLRDDIEEIVKVVLKKSKRVVISTNGYFTSKIIKLAKKIPDVGIRISIEGLPAANDELRGLKDGFDHGLRTLMTLHDMGIKDIGFGITVSDRNHRDMIELYRLSNAVGLEFATAVTHNSYYFHKHDNKFEDHEAVAKSFEEISERLLRSKKPKEWFRAYFNMGLANKVRGGDRPLPCEAGTDVFFLDPYGSIMPCNGSDEPMIMGDLNKQSFDEIWTSRKAEQVRVQVKNCTKQCWMIGSVAPAMKKRVSVPLKWVLKNKLRLMTGRGKDICLDPVVN
jgi:MoaA/NifB/PqqE/SkfB family radical SAM enzyme